MSNIFTTPLAIVAGLAVCAYSGRAVAYAMQGAHIVGIFYTIEQAKAFYERNNGKTMPIIAWWDEARWEKRTPNPLQSSRL